MKLHEMVEAEKAALVQENRFLRGALEATTWRQAAAARKLGITPRQIGYRIRKYGLTPPGHAS